MFGLGILLKVLGWGKTLVGFAWDAIKGIMGWAVKYPFQFLTIVFLIASLWFVHEWNDTKADLVTANKTIKSKQDFIDQQGKRLDEYVKSLADEKKTLAQTVATNNAAVANLKKTADNALAGAQKAAQKAAISSKAFSDLAAKYSTANPSTGTADQRIAREQSTTDAFISDWKKQ